jgi:hypothetical protein
MSDTGENDEMSMGLRKGESITDFSDWDNEVIEWDSSTGIYYVAGKPVSMCQGVEMFKKKDDEI